MPNELLEPEEFLARLTQCFEITKARGETGTVWLTHKRFTHQAAADAGDHAEMDATNGPSGEAGPSSREYDVLIRCTDGKDVNFSSRISPVLLPTFHASYGSLLKAAMAPQMRKRDKKKEKQKLEARIKKRKELYEDVDFTKKPAVAPTDGEGAKKRLGHRQRKRKILAQQKKETERAKLEEKEKEGAKRGLGVSGL